MRLGYFIVKFYRLQLDKFRGHNVLFINGGDSRSVIDLHRSDIHLRPLPGK